MEHKKGEQPKYKGRINNAVLETQKENKRKKVEKKNRRTEINSLSIKHLKNIQIKKKYMKM